MSKAEAVKENIDLAGYVRSCGIKLSKHGRNDLKGLCPFHNDTNPSLIITPAKGLFNCPACGTGGTVIDFAMKYHNMDFKEAVKLLEEQSPAITKRSKPAKKETSQLPVERARELLEKTVKFYEKTFNDCTEGKNYLEQRGITDAGLYAKHRLGYANGSLFKALPKAGKILEELEQLGVLVKLSSGKYIERFYKCVVVPVLDVEGNTTTLYARNCEDKSNRSHLYLPNRPTGLFNIQTVKTYPEIILVESCMDALSLQTAGVKNVVSIQSTNGLDDADIKLFREFNLSKITLLMDGDKAGQDAAFDLIQRLSEHFEISNIPLPESLDPNECLQQFGAEKMLSILQGNHTPKQENDTPKPPETPGIERIENGFALNCGLRRYEVIGLEKKPRSLRATVRMLKAGKLHVDTIDFYSSRQRRQLSQDICGIFEELPETVNSDIEKILKTCEESNNKENAPKFTGETEKVKISMIETKEAEEFAKAENLVERIQQDFKTCGLIGEESNKLLCYLAMTSRKMPEPLSVLILSSSGAGKTALQDAALNFCPPEDLVKLTNLSAKALFYKEQSSLKHKVLAIEEGAGAEDATYAIRNLISSDGLTSEVAMRDPQTGKLTTMANTVEGPTSIFCTTTNPDVDAETKSRFLVTGIDESREQTRKILNFQKQRHSLDGLQQNMKKGKVLALHRNFQRLLKPLPVVNPHIDKLSYSDDRLQCRRAQPQYLNIINTVAFLRQFQKEVKTYKTGNSKIEFIEVDETDIAIGSSLAVEILGKTLDELSIPARDLLGHIDNMLTEKLKNIKQPDNAATLFKRDLTFTRRELRDFSGWTQTRLRNHLKELIDLEYVLIESGMNGRVLQTYKLVYDGQGKDGKKFINGVKGCSN